MLIKLGMGQDQSIFHLSEDYLGVSSTGSPMEDWSSGVESEYSKHFSEEDDKTSLNYTELYTMLARVASKINDRPLGIKKLTESDFVPLTVNQLLIGKTDSHGDHNVFHDRNYFGDRNR